jgi:hypothetical protein
MTQKRNEKDKEKRGPHWVVQLCCRRFNSAGPHQSSYKDKKETRGEEKRREEMR